MKSVLILLAIGAAAGLMGALCGVGGGIVMVPAFTLALGMDQKTAVATSMAAVVVTALVATANNMRSDGLIDWKIVGVVALSAAACSWWGSDLMKQLSSPVLTKIFAFLMIVVGMRMLWK
ncbi:MAG: hypothetical protein RLZZ224_1113 [Verrucomicrobiota bacterium]|jgi:hypothetical protein